MKKMIKWFDAVFSFSEERHSYKDPIIKLLIFPLIGLLLFYRPKIGIAFLDAVITIFCLVILYFSIIYCLYLPVAEIFAVSANRRKNAQKENTYKPMSFGQVAQMCLDNDIIDFAVIIRNSICHVGSSSDLNPGESIFFDKRYYINSIEFLSFDLFTKELFELSENGDLFVVSIDDVKQGAKSTSKRGNLL